jgi:hypothetical protein
VTDASATARPNATAAIIAAPNAQIGACRDAIPSASSAAPESATWKVGLVGWSLNGQKLARQRAMLSLGCGDAPWYLADMSLLRCSTCARHVKVTEVSCPFCGARARAPGKGMIATLAGATAMTVGLGCAYGMPSDYGVRDSGLEKPDVAIGDAANDAPPVDSGMDAADAAVDASDGSKDASADGG